MIYFTQENCLKIVLSAYQKNIFLLLLGIFRSKPIILKISINIVSGMSFILDTINIKNQVIYV